MRHTSGDRSHSLIEVAGSRFARRAQKAKAELIYQYLLGPAVRHRISAMVERFTELHPTLIENKRAMTRLRAKPEEQLRSVIDSTGGHDGDLQGIAGGTLKELEGCELPLIESRGSVI
jgi:hypothetical protein